MAFGDYATLLDDFNRANEDPLSDGGRWTNRIDPVNHNDMQTASNLCAPPTTVGPGSAWWNPNYFGPDVEAYYTVSALTADNGYLRVFARVIDPRTNGAKGYMVQINILSGTDTTELYRMDSATSFTQIGSTFSANWTAGWKIGLECIGSTITAYQNTGGGWTSIITATDETYPGSGFAAIGGRKDTGSNIGRLDDVYAGTISLFTTRVGQYVTRVGGKGSA